MSSIYQEIILDHYHAPRNHGTLAGPTHSATVSNPLCGDVLTFQLDVKDGVVVEVRFSGEGCALSQASASILSEFVLKKSLAELIKMDKNAMIDLIGIATGPTRLKCLLLSYEALQRAIKIQKNDKA